MQVYFIDNDDYFQNRLQKVDENDVEYEDNDSRAIFYARGVLETVKKLRWCPDIIHCHGWMTALAPLYIKKAYKDEPSFRDSKVIFSVYEDDFKSSFNNDFTSKLLLKGIEEDNLKSINKPVDYTELIKLAISYSDGVIQNSESVNQDVMKFANESGILSLIINHRITISRLLTNSTTKYGKLKRNKFKSDKSMKIKYLWVALLALVLFGCDDNTGNLGESMMQDGDKIEVKNAIFEVTTRSILADSIYARTSTAYLGKYTDPDFGVFEADFMTQFNCIDNLTIRLDTIPDSLIVKDSYKALYIYTTIKTFLRRFNRAKQIGRL